jgi:hypothetical protein
MQRFGYELDHAGIGGSLFGKKTRFFSAPNRPGHEANHSPLFELRVRMSKAVHPFTHMPSSYTQT